MALVALIRYKSGTYLVFILPLDWKLMGVIS